MAKVHKHFTVAEFAKYSGYSANNIYSWFKGVKCPIDGVKIYKFGGQIQVDYKGPELTGVKIKRDFSRENTKYLITDLEAGVKYKGYAGMVENLGKYPNYWRWFVSKNTKRFKVENIKDFRSKYFKV